MKTRTYGWVAGDFNKFVCGWCMLGCVWTITNHDIPGTITNFIFAALNGAFAWIPRTNP